MLDQTRRSLIFLVAIIVTLVFVYFVYSLGFPGGKFFDDEPHLNDLMGVDSLESALIYVMNGQGGPLGRPLSYMSFLINAGSWPSAVSDLLHVNTCIHLINGLLLIWLSYRIALLFPQRITAPHWFAYSAGAIWLAQPLLVSASLMTIQRMTTLSATFVFGSCLVFMVGLGRLQARPLQAYLLISLAAGLGTVLAVLTKENGILLPALLLLLQSLVLPSIAGDKPPVAYLRWRAVFLYFPQFVILSYILVSFPSIEAGYVHRDFTMTERLLTQSRVLVDYLRLLVAPSRAEFGPFHDDYLVSTGLLTPPATLGAIVLLALATATAIACRKRYPVAFFGFLWFMIGHFLESNVFSLEHYFEHRNYVPAFGPIFFLCYWAWTRQGKLRLVGRVALSAYGVLIGFVLVATTSVWGNKSLAFSLWFEQHPDSERATQSLANLHFNAGNMAEAQRVIANLSSHKPKNIGLALQTLQGACPLGNEQQILNKLLHPEGESLLQTGRISPVVCDAVNALTRMAVNGECGAVTVGAMQQILDKILANPAFGLQKEVNNCIYDMQAQIYFHDKNLDRTMYYLERAFEAKQYLNLAIRLVAIPATAGLYDLALQNLDMALQRAPRNPLLRRQWERQLLALRDDVEKAKNVAKPGSLQGRREHEKPEPRSLPDAK